MKKQSLRRLSYPALLIASLLFLNSGKAYAYQSRADLEMKAGESILQGTIKTEKGDVFPGATVLLQHTKPLISTASDVNGSFQIKTKAGKYLIVIYATGYIGIDTTVELKSNTLTELEFRLKEQIILTQMIPRLGLTSRDISISEMKSTEIIPGISSEQTSTSDSYRAAMIINKKKSKRRKNPSPVLSTRTYYAENTEEYKFSTENTFKNVFDQPQSTFSIDVDNASYSNIRRFIKNDLLPPPDAVRIEEMINYFKYDYPKPEKNEIFSIYTEAATSPWNKKNTLVQIGITGKAVNFQEAPPNHLTFLVDVSGSMDVPDKLPLVKSSLKLLVEKMRHEDRISVVVYAGAAGSILEGESTRKKENIMEAIEGLRSGGSTAGEQGIILAYKLAKEHFIKGGNNRIILATDGDFNVGVNSESELISLIEAKRDEGIALSVLGFGEANLKDAKMEALADHGNGNYYYIDDILEAEKIFVNQLAGTLYTIAKDVKLQVEFNPAKVKSYRLIGYENRVLEKEDFENDKKDAGDLGAGHTVTALYEIEPREIGADSMKLTAQLKYQTTTINAEAYTSHELMYVKIRYKLPDKNVSEEIRRTVTVATKNIKESSNNLRFAASVASLGQLLKSSGYRGNLTYEDVVKMAKSAKGEDDEGHRAEFIKLVEKARLLK